MKKDPVSRMVDEFCERAYVHIRGKSEPPPDEKTSALYESLQASLGEDDPRREQIDKLWTAMHGRTV